MKDGKRVLITAHGNSLRALVKYFENLSEDEIVGVNIPTGVPLVYEFDENMHVVSKEYLGDAEAIKAKMNAVAKQGSKKSFCPPFIILNTAKGRFLKGSGLLH